MNELPIFTAVNAAAEIAPEMRRGIFWNVYRNPDAEQVAEANAEKQFPPLPAEPEKPSIKELFDNDMVEHPTHYTSHPAGIEAITVLREASDYNLGQAMKYLWRVLWGSKGRDIEDVAKARFYIDDWLKRRGYTDTTTTAKPKSHLLDGDEPL